MSETLVGSVYMWADPVQHEVVCQRGRCDRAPVRRAVSGGVA